MSDAIHAAEQALAAGRGDDALEAATRADAEAPTAESANLRGRALVVLNRRDEAAVAFRTAVTRSPAFERGWANLAKLAFDAARDAEGLALVEEGLLHVPTSTRLLRAIANHHLRAGSPALAADYLARLVDPPPEASHALGVARLAAGDVEGAIGPLLLAVKGQPTNLDWVGRLASACQATGARDVALEALRLAGGHCTSADDLVHLAKRAADARATDLEEALARRALEADPRHGEAYLLLADAYIARGAPDEGDRVLARGLEAASSPEPGTCLVKRHRDAHRADEAAKVLARLGERFPDDLAVLLARALELRERGSFLESMRLLERGARLDPTHVVIHVQLAQALSHFRHPREAAETYRHALRLEPSDAATHASAVFHAHYPAPADPTALFLGHARFGAKFGFARPVQQRERSWSPDRRIRIGYVSADYRKHSVAYFLLPILRAHDREHFEVFCYATNHQVDDMTDVFAEVSTYRPCAHLTNQAMAERIAEDGIDLLIDLGGYTTPNRLRVFARRPAPIQLTYLGYPDTSGCPEIDYRITDATADPVGTADELHTERLVRLPVGWTFSPYDDVPISPRASERITFASFNTLAKINDRVATTFARILKRVPGSRLLLKTHLFSDPAARAELLEGLVTLGLPRERVELTGWTDTRAEHLAFHREVDVALDPYPYNGTTTTCDALWMGVPVVTLEGAIHAGRVGKSLLRAVGLEDLVATTEEEYVERAVALAKDPDRRAELRANLRDRFLASPLGDAKSFTLAYEAALRGVWRDRCEAVRSGTAPPPGKRLVPLGEGATVTVPADPTTRETFRYLERGWDALPDDGAIQTLVGAETVFVDAVSDAGAAALRAAKRGAKVFRAELSEAVVHTARVNDVAFGSLATSAAAWREAGVTLARAEPEDVDARRAALGAGVPVLLPRGVRGDGEASAWAFRPGRGCFSPSEPDDVEPPSLLMPRSSEDVFAAHLARVLDRRPASRGEALEWVLDGEADTDAGRALGTWLAVVALAGTLPPDDLERLTVARALVHLGRRRAAARLVEPLVRRPPRHVHGDWLPPLPHQTAGDAPEVVEATSIEAFVKLSAPTGADQSDPVIPLLLRWHCLDGRDLEMCRRLGLTYARER